MTSDVDCEERVRLYLSFLSDPASLVDAAQVTTLQQQFNSTSDIMQRLKLAEELEQAENPSIDNIRGGFVDCAKSVAEANGLSAAAFIRLGVPESDLRQAGFKFDSAAQSETTTPKRRLTVDQVIALIPADSFSARSLQMRSGASPMTVRKTIERLLESGDICSLGPDPEHSARGRAPELFALTSSN